MPTLVCACWAWEPQARLNDVSTACSFAAVRRDAYDNSAEPLPLVP